jgi:hypothetical protein
VIQIPTARSMPDMCMSLTCWLHAFNRKRQIKTQKRRLRGSHFGGYLTTCNKHAAHTIRCVITPATHWCVSLTSKKIPSSPCAHKRVFVDCIISIHTADAPDVLCDRAVPHSISSTLQYYRRVLCCPLSRYSVLQLCQTAITENDPFAHQYRNIS